MALTKEQKEALIADIDKKVDSAESVVFVKYEGLGVDQSAELRTQLAGDGGSFTATKKTLLKRVLDARKFEGEQPELPGGVAIAYAKDHVAPARETYEFEKKHEGVVEILGSVLEGRYLSKDETIALAQIPNRDILLGMFVNVINAPVSNFVRTLQAVPQEFVGTLDAVARLPAGTAKSRA